MFLVVTVPSRNTFALDEQIARSAVEALSPTPMSAVT